MGIVVCSRSGFGVCRGGREVRPRKTSWHVIVTDSVTDFAVSIWFVRENTKILIFEIPMLVLVLQYFFSFN